MSTAAVLKPAVADPRVSLQGTSDDITGIGHVADHIPFNLHDPNVSFEEYYHYASITRAEEKAANEEHIRAVGPQTLKTTLLGRFSKGGNSTKLSPSTPPTTESPGDGEKMGLGEKSGPPALLNAGAGGVSAAEWKQASRALRTCGWGSIFYLITTDILGPFSTPWAFAQMGYGPGVALFTVFGFFACYSGWVLWNVFLHLDSDKYPLLNLGDVFYRVFGAWARHVVNVTQFIQMILMVAALILSNGQAISQVSSTKLCFVVCLVVFMAAGMILGQIRTLQRFGWLANFSVWINLLIIFFCMGVAANSAPNYATVAASFGSQFSEGPIHRYAGTPPAGMATGGSGFIGSLNGLNQAVYSYSGAMFFIAFLAEMRHPFDFWKGLLCANIFIYVVYMFFGIFVYSYQGQFSYNPVMQGLSPYGWQTACNIMNIVTGLIAATLYGNIGIKVAYVEVFQELLHAPALTTTMGKVLWCGIVPAYWAIAFLLAAAVPQFSYITGLIGALFLLSFTYTLPAILAVGYQVHLDAMTPEEHFDPATGTYSAVDRGMTRWIRGFKHKWLFNSVNSLYALGALVTTVLGVYSSVVSLIGAFSGKSVATSFGCASPV